VETDSQEVVSLWKNKGKHRSKNTAILDDVEEMVSNFTFVQVLHTERSANFTVHLCEQHASST
jgi:hypothetical protein